jgi:tetratricopeptide (TPR) repeat protein
MKYAVLTSLAVLLTVIFISCQPKQSEISAAKVEIQVFENARKAHDMGTCIAALHRIMVLDSTANWAADSLAWYYYFFTQNVDAAEIYNKIALKRTPDDIGMNEIRAKIEIQKRNDSLGIALFEQLWNRTKDYTFLYNISATHILTGRLNEADSMVTEILSLNPKPVGSVRIEVSEVRSRQEVPVEAAFIYLKSYLMYMGGNRNEAIKLIRRCLEIKPDYLLAQDMYENLTQPQQGGPMR